MGISKKTFYCLFLVILLSTSSLLQAVTDWTVLVYVQANNNLYGFALKNFSDMTTVGSNSNLKTLVQWYQPNQKGVWRYRIEKGKMILEECLSNNSDGSSPQDLVDAMRWAVTKYPASKYSLILWNHGVGVLDPVWGNKYSSYGKEMFGSSFNMDPEFVSNNPRIQLEGITTPTKTSSWESEKITLSSEAMHPTPTTLAMLSYSTSTSTQRGILFNEQTKRYMDNTNLSLALKDIYTNVLRRKKIDLLGMDACLMGMIEIGYLARNYANYFVASQEVELGHGWNYLSFLAGLAIQKVTSQQAAQNIVWSFDEFYKKKIQFYTQSAVDLTRIDAIKNNINQIVTAFNSCKASNNNVIKNLVRKARRSSLQFSTTTYVDLYTFYDEFKKQLENSSVSLIKNKNGVSQLKQYLAAGMRLIEQAVVANAVGNNLSRAKGISIYFPLAYIDASYPKTCFARETQWLSFLKEMCQN